MKIEELPDGGCIVTFEGETIRYTKEEVEEMKRDYQDALKKVNGFSGEVSKKMDVQTTKTVNETIVQICELIQNKIKSCSADDHIQLPSLIKALATLVCSQSQNSHCKLH